MEIAHLAVGQTHAARTSVCLVPSGQTAVRILLDKAVHASQPEIAFSIECHHFHILSATSVRPVRERPEKISGRYFGKRDSMVGADKDIAVVVPADVPYHIVRKRTAVSRAVAVADKPACIVLYEQAVVRPYPCKAAAVSKKIFYGNTFNLHGRPLVPRRIPDKAVFCSQKERSWRGRVGGNVYDQVVVVSVPVRKRVLFHLS